nr:TIGR03943 family protein [uncultured Desulfobulbus sp.]
MFAKLLQGLVLFTWAVFFFWLYFVDPQQLAKLLHPKLWWLVVTGGAILVLFAAMTLKNIRTHQQTKPLRWNWPSIAIMLVPVFYFWYAQSAHFGSSTFLSRTTTSPGMSSSLTYAIPNTLPQQQIDQSQTITSLTQAAFFPRQLNGHSADILCQAMTNKKLPENLFICYRFQITCCAADALPIFTFIRVPKKIALPQNDDWVRVKGTIAPQTVEDRIFPLIHASSLTPEPAPPFPYIY